MKSILFSKLIYLFIFFQTSTKAFTQTNNFTKKNVQFFSEGVTLAGTIIIPQKVHSAIVIVHGSDPVKRYLDFAINLASEGIAVFTYDKRGVGESGGIYVGPTVGTNNLDVSNLNLLANDASNAINFFRSNLKNKNIPFGLLGFSQAGWIIPLSAKMNRNIDFMVIFSGPVVTTLEQLRFQFYTNGDLKFWDTHLESEVHYHVKNDPDKFDFIATDPMKSLSKIKIPGFWLFGGNDIQVPVKLSMENIDILKMKNKSYNYILYPLLGHNTAFAQSRQPLEDAIKWIKSLNILQNSK